MSIKPFLSASVRTQLAMTQGLKQALKILQMPQIDLAQWLREEIEKNPLLEETPFSPSLYHHAPLPEVAAKESLYKSIEKQIGELFLKEREKSLAFALLEKLDERGIFSESVEELESQFEDFAPILFKLQTLDPPGIFARDLKECWLLKIRSLRAESRTVLELIDTDFEDLSKGRFAKLRKKWGDKRVQRTLEVLQSLPLQPLLSRTPEPSPPLFIDLWIQKEDESWSLSLVDQEIPKIVLNPSYSQLKLEQKEEKESMRQWLSKAKWLLRSLKRRKHILLQIGELIVKTQKGFLEGTSSLAPLSMKEGAELVHLHESTLSRALADKYVQTPIGIFPIKTFFSLRSFASEEIKQRLQEMIDGEDPKAPMTDEKLSQELFIQGYKTARRTIVKYRKEMNVPSAKMRGQMNIS